MDVVDAGTSSLETSPVRTLLGERSAVDGDRDPRRGLPMGALPWVRKEVRGRSEEQKAVCSSKVKGVGEGTPEARRESRAGRGALAARTPH